MGSLGPLSFGKGVGRKGEGRGRKGEEDREKRGIEGRRGRPPREEDRVRDVKQKGMERAGEEGERQVGGKGRNGREDLGWGHSGALWVLEKHRHGGTGAGALGPGPGRWWC